MSKLTWQNKGSSPIGDEHGPIYIFEALTAGGARIGRRRKRGCVSRNVYEVPAIGRVYGTLREALAMADGAVVAPS